MVLHAYWRKTVLGGLLVSGAGLALQCGGSPESPFTGDFGGSQNGGTAGSVGPKGGAGGAHSGSTEDAGSSQSDAGEAGEDGSGGSAGSVSAGSGGKGGAVGVGGASGSAGAAIGGTAGHVNSAGAGGVSVAGSAGTGGLQTAGSAGSAGAAGVSGSVGASGSSGSAGSSGFAGSSGSAGNGSSGAGGSGGAGAAGGASGSAGAGGSGGSCGAGIAFQPRAPVVFFLLDRSSSMFAPIDNWSPLKASVLATINAYASQIRFGLAAYTGVASKTCPLDLTSAGGIALDNYAAINQVLSPLGSPGEKAESPTAAAVASIRAAVTAQSGSSKTIFLITDGGHDFCDDADLRCPADALVAQLQSTFTAGVRTSVFGIKGAPYLDLTFTQWHADAGAGAPVVGDALNLNYACTAQTPWYTQWVAKGSPANQALGTYVGSSSTTPTPYTLLDTTQPDTMTSALETATAALKSCTYDLTGAQVNQSLAAQAVVRIDGTSIPMDSSNGWRLNSSTELELVGSACTAWRTAAAQTIAFDFPCSILTP